MKLLRLTPLDQIDAGTWDGTMDAELKTDRWVAAAYSSRMREELHDYMIVKYKIKDGWFYDDGELYGPYATETQARRAWWWGSMTRWTRLRRGAR
ncbi:MAG: hypothetical protein JOZ88_07330 [Hyphomicrobiales bacterium]|nr:hypothetical protein [Hyphomicrobiales bacterium]